MAKVGKRKNKKSNKQTGAQAGPGLAKTSRQLSNIPFSCIVKPVGARCNLRCAHCFYLDKSELYESAQGGVMSESLLERFVRDYIASQPKGTGEINFIWQGGEPTLAGLDFFRLAVDLEKKYAPANMRVQNSFQTNGTLLDDNWGKFFHDHEFLIGISIDGPEKLHDRYRRDPAGRGSLAPALRGLEVLRRHQVEFNVLTCVQNDNAECAAEIYAYLKSLGATFIQFIPIIEHLGEPPNPSDHRPNRLENNFNLTDRSVSGEQFGQFMIEIFDLWLERDVGRVFIQFFDVCLGLMLNYPAGVCVHSRNCGRGLVVEHNGDVYACDHYVFPEYLIGSLEHDSLRKLAADSQLCSFGRAKETALPGVCRECAYLGLCHGGCPAHRTELAADGSPGLNHLCIGYRSFYQHAMPVLRAMGRALQQQRPASDWMSFF